MYTEFILFIIKLYFKEFNFHYLFIELLLTKYYFTKMYYYKIINL